MHKRRIPIFSVKVTGLMQSNTSVSSGTGMLLRIPCMIPVIHPMFIEMREDAGVCWTMQYCGLTWERVYIWEEFVSVHLHISWIVRMWSLLLTGHKNLVTTNIMINRTHISDGFCTEGYLEFCLHSIFYFLWKLLIKHYTVCKVAEGIGLQFRCVILQTGFKHDPNT